MSKPDPRDIDYGPQQEYLADISSIIAILADRKGSPSYYHVHLNHSILRGLCKVANSNAAIVLCDILYWHGTKKSKRHQDDPCNGYSGHTLWQYSRADLMERLGLSRDEVTLAMAKLEEWHVIRRYYRNPHAHCEVLVELNPTNISRLMHGEAPVKDWTVFRYDPVKRELRYSAEMESKKQTAKPPVQTANPSASDGKATCSDESRRESRLEQTANPDRSKRSLREAVVKKPGRYTPAQEKRSNLEPATQDSAPQENIEPSAPASPEASVDVFPAAEVASLHNADSVVKRPVEGNLLRGQKIPEPPAKRQAPVAKAASPAATKPDPTVFCFIRHADDPEIFETINLLNQSQPGPEKAKAKEEIRQHLLKDLKATPATDRSKEIQNKIEALKAAIVRWDADKRVGGCYQYIKRDKAAIQALEAELKELKPTTEAETQLQLEMLRQQRQSQGSVNKTPVRKLIPPPAKKLKLVTA
jgi:hypothetical protein